MKRSAGAGPPQQPDDVPGSGHEPGSGHGPGSGHVPHSGHAAAGPAEALVERFRLARRDATLTVLEGFHPLKHALRFGARVSELIAVNPAGVANLTESLATDLGEALAARTRYVPEAIFRRLSPHPPRTGMIGIAARPPADVAEALADAAPRPVVFLERPSNLGNLGAVIRVAAAAGARAVLCTGDHDPWHPAALRGSAGLHFALTVAQVADLPSSDRPVLALHPDGEELRAGSIPGRAILVFGSERHGLSAAVLARADQRLRIRMQQRVSSLNLATAAAVALYSIEPAP